MGYTEKQLDEAIRLLLPHLPPELVKPHTRWSYMKDVAVEVFRNGIECDASMAHAMVVIRQAFDDLYKDGFFKFQEE